MGKAQFFEEGERILGCIKQVPGIFGTNKFPENALDEDNIRALNVWEKQVCLFLSENGPKLVFEEAKRIDCFNPHIVKTVLINKQFVK